ncbi:MAG: hypothetical protein IT334_09575 [Thermomicrobiales bacterium]|nr:hypothetical protein [Thermomicrobiales bacterium]
MPITDAEIERYLARYGDALAAFDAETSASLWGLPGRIVSDTAAIALDARDQMVTGLRSSYPLYQALGLGSVGHTVLERADLTERIVRLRVRWHFYDVDGVHMTDSDYEYVLRVDEDGLHAYCSVGIDDLVKITELAERRGVDLSAFTSSE